MLMIDTKVEEVARELLGHAIQGELDEFAAVAEAIGQQRYREAGRLCQRVSGYIAIDVSGQEWPACTDVRRLASITASGDTRFPLEEKDVYEYLAYVSLGIHPILEMFPDEKKAATLPFFVTAILLDSYRPEGKGWWEYLDVIEKALNDAAPLAPETIPAVILLARKAQILRT
jgi:hypothetical protein